MKPLPRAFIIQRDEDVSGVSGTGRVAEGVQFSDGWAVTHWLGGPPKTEAKTEVWHNKGTEPFEKISGHGGRTRVIWLDQLPPNQGPLTGIEVRDPCERCNGMLIPRTATAEHYRQHLVEAEAAIDRAHAAADRIALISPWGRKTAEAFRAHLAHPGTKRQVNVSPQVDERPAERVEVVQPPSRCSCSSTAAGLEVCPLGSGRTPKKGA